MTTGMVGIIGKHSLISLLLIILRGGNHVKNKPDPKDTSVLADEERGEIAFAAKCAQSLLNWMNMTVAEAELFVDGQGPYFSGGEEKIEIPALVEHVKDPIFPDMNGFL